MRKPLRLSCAEKITTHNRLNNRKPPCSKCRNTALYYLIIITASHQKQMEIQLLLHKKKIATGNQFPHQPSTHAHTYTHILAHYCVLSWIGKTLTTRPNVHKFNFLFKKKKETTELIKSQLNYTHSYEHVRYVCAYINILYVRSTTLFPFKPKHNNTHNFKLKLEERQFVGYIH